MDGKSLLIGISIGLAVAGMKTTRNKVLVPAARHTVIPAVRAMKRTVQPAAKKQELPYDSVDCDNANGDPKRCTVEPDEKK